MVEALGLSLTEFVFYVINFLILVGLLTKFLYRPFLNMLETRKQSIQDALDNAELINSRADEKMENYDMAFLLYAAAFDGERPVYTYFRERIFRRGFGYEWQGAVHEAIAPRGRILYSDAKIRSAPRR